jgi:hypothetical protein
LNFSPGPATLFLVPRLCLGTRAKSAGDKELFTAGEGLIADDSGRNRDPTPAVQQTGVRVAELELFHVRIPFASRSVTPARRSETDNVVVRCVLDDGTVGHGEGVPRDYVTGETIDSVLELLQRSDLTAQLGAWNDFAAAVAAGRPPPTGTDWR